MAIREGLVPNFSDSLPAVLTQVDGLTYRTVTYTCKTELIQDFFSYMLISENRKKNLKQNLEEFGLSGVELLLDYRTFELIRLFKFYKYQPNLIDNYIFFYAYNELSDITNVRLI